MPDSEFSADRFEFLFLHELRDVYGHGMPHFLPLRTLGSTVSFDVAVFTDYWKINIQGKEIDSHLLRSLMPVQRRAVLPNKYLSVFLRFEAPFHATTSRAKDPEVFELWKERGFRGYYRWDADEERNRLMSKLEKSLGQTGFIRHAAPCFSSHGDCDALQAAGTLIQNTHFQSPGRLASQEYDSYASAVLDGRVHPDSDDVEQSAFLQELMERRNRLEIEPFMVHLANLWGTIQGMIRAESDDEDPFNKDGAEAERALGPAGSLLVDPLRINRGHVSFAGFDERPDLTLKDYATIIFAMNRFAREKLGCRWLVVYS